MTRKELSDAMRAEMEAALNSAAVWHIHAVGWLDADTPDPDFIGHAMWQTDPPVDIDWTVFNARRVNTEQPTPLPAEWLKLLAVSGADFEGLMKAARMSIGLFLLQRTIIVAAEFSDDDFMELHWMSALIYLATASERLREFLVAASFRQTQAEYLTRGKVYRNKKRTRYATPFAEALGSFSSPKLASALDPLHAMALEIQSLRNKRNELIHEIATSMGHRERQRLSERQRPIDPADVSYSELQSAIKALRRERADRMAETTKELVEWYTLLLRASNEAFVFEHHRRRQAN
jgi:hypothetical protein